MMTDNEREGQRRFFRGDPVGETNDGHNSPCFGYGGFDPYKGWEFPVDRATVCKTRERQHSIDHIASIGIVIAAAMMLVFIGYLLGTH